MKLSTFILLFFCAVLKANAGHLWINEGMWKRNLEFTTIDSIRISSSCVYNSKCQARSAIVTKIEIPDTATDPIGLVVNPMTRVCHKLGGKSLITEDLSLRQYDICQFKDKSFFLSLDYFQKMLRRDTSHK